MYMLSVLHSVLSVVGLILSYDVLLLSAICPVTDSDGQFTRKEKRFNSIHCQILFSSIFPSYYVRMTRCHCSSI